MQSWIFVTLLSLLINAPLRIKSTNFVQIFERYEDIIFGYIAQP